MRMLKEIIEAHEKIFECPVVLYFEEKYERLIVLDVSYQSMKKIEDELNMSGISECCDVWMSEVSGNWYLFIQRFFAGKVI